MRLHSDYPLSGVIGHPVAHSRSPLVHRHWLRTHGISGDYVAMDVLTEDLGAVLDVLPKMGFVGCNITIPHKVAVLSIADRITDSATLIGAANTLLFLDDGRIQADNTDGYGFLANLRQQAPAWQPEAGPALVLGAGGACRAVLVALLESGVPQIFLSNRTRAKAEALRLEFGTKITVVDWVQAGNVVEESALLVNTTSLGMNGQPDLRVPLDGLRAQTVVCDLIYAPLRTKLLRAADEIGCTTVDGLGMLLHQAVPGFERWFGHRPDVDDAVRKAALG